MTPYRLCRTCGRYVHESQYDMNTGTCPYCEEKPKLYTSYDRFGRAIKVTVPLSTDDVK